MKRYRILLILLAMISSMVLKGQGNTSYGTCAGNAGYYNSFIGYYAGDVVTGYSNTFNGYYAGKLTTSGGYNLFSGALSGNYNTTGGHNTYLGFRVCVLATTAAHNVSIGYKSGTYISSGSYNVFAGLHAGYRTSTGSNNVYLGANSGYNTTGSNNIFIGYSSGSNETGSNKLYIENSNSSSPLIYGEFDNDFVTINGKLGIGTTECYDAKLAVDGTIMAKEIIVTVADFPDYVFDDSYRLMSLADLESYIKSNKHLPGIKTRKEVLKNGVPLGELNIQLLEKIEELTLHLIDLDKRATRISKDGEILLANTKTY